MNYRLKSTVSLVEGLQKGLLRGFTMKDTLTSSPTVHDVIEGMGVLDAGGPRHRASLEEINA